MWKDADVIDTKNEILDYIKGLSNWPMCLIGDPGSGRTSLLAQVSSTWPSARAIDLPAVPRTQLSWSLLRI